MDGADGMDKVASIMAGLRSEQPEALGGQRVVSVMDYQSGEKRIGDEVETIDFPRVDAMKLKLEHGWMCVRPVRYGAEAQSLSRRVGRDECAV